MDRNYQGGMIRGEYELVVKNKGTQVASFDDAIAQIKEYHSEGYTDAMIPPIVIGKPRTVTGETSYINAIFRADRQEPITATLLGMKDFHRRACEAVRNSRFVGRLQLDGRSHWPDDGFDDRLSQRLPEKRESRRWSSIGHTSTISCTCSTRTPRISRSSSSAKASKPSTSACSLADAVRCRWNRPSIARLSPAMERRKVSATTTISSSSRRCATSNWAPPLERAGREAKHDLIIINWPGPDMIGHLIMNHFESCIETLNSIEAVLNKVVPVLRAAGYCIVVTSDHGNVEHYGPDHGNNPVLTTVIPPAGRDSFKSRYRQEARLFDIAATVLWLLGYDPMIRSKMPPIPKVVQDSPARLVGVPLVSEK